MMSYGTQMEEEYLKEYFLVDGFCSFSQPSPLNIYIFSILGLLPPVNDVALYISLSFRKKAIYESKPQNINIISVSL